VNQAAGEIERAVADLFEQARRASERAYSPYSGARVGACVLDDAGNVHSGCNVENASYGLTQCAERNALQSAINAGMKPGGSKLLLIYATGFEALAPCGACRQVMNELLATDAVIISCVSESDYHSWTMGELLPSPFILA
jgi:cytidine deaminase